MGGFILMLILRWKLEDMLPHLFRVNSVLNSFKQAYILTYYTHNIQYLSYILVHLSHMDLNTDSLVFSVKIYLQHFPSLSNILFQKM